MVDNINVNSNLNRRRGYGGSRRQSIISCEINSLSKTKVYGGSIKVTVVRIDLAYTESERGYQAETVMVTKGHAMPRT